MKIDSNEWSEIEARFRERARNFMHFCSTHLRSDPSQKDLYDRMNLIAKATSAHEFECQWKQSIGVGAGLNIAEELAEESKRYQLPHLLIEDAISHTGMVLGKESTARSINFIPKIDYPWDSPLTHNHAFYAIYVAWKPDSRIVVPDNRPNLLKSLAVDESMLRVITPRQFEELIAYVYECLGCKTLLTQQSRDFGADVLAWHGGPFNSEALIAIQVKRYASQNKVGLKEIFELHGAVSHYHADLGHVVTSSDFTRPARQFATEQHIHLVNMHDLQKEINRLFT